MFTQAVTNNTNLETLQLSEHCAVVTNLGSKDIPIYMH